MKVNIVYNSRSNTGLSQDASILRGIITAIFDKDVEIHGVNFNFPECSDADFNIFLEVINPSLFSYARRNIWIPNIEWTYTNWKPYLNMVDEIWAKTKETQDILSKHTTTPIKYIGWTSIDKNWHQDRDKKNYYKAIVPIGKNIYRHPKPIFQAYLRFAEDYPLLYSKLPILNVVYDPSAIQVTVPTIIKDKVIIYDRVLKESEYDDLFRECGLCVCLSVAEGFGHAVNESMSLGCNLILSPIRPFQEDLITKETLGIFFGDVYHSVPQPDCLGTYVDTSVTSIVDSLRKYISLTFHEHREASLAVRDMYETRHKNWIETMKILLKDTFVAPTPYILKDTLPKEEELPDVSIVTITRDRRIFMPLAKYSYMIQSYPEEKMEWVIVDDGDDLIEDTLIGVPNVTYVKCDKKMTISEKRNLGVEKALYNVIVMMDDDDVYPNNSVLQRVALLHKEPAKQCGFCTTIPCYDISRYSSFMNVPPRTLPMSERVSEATLVFVKQFWEERKFDDSIHVGEGNAFIRGREQMCREISPQEVIVSLTHPLNTSSRKIPDFKEPNGCHFGFNEKLFAVVSEIGETLKLKKCSIHDSISCECLNSADQTESGCGGDRGESGGGESGGDDHPPSQQVPQE